MTIKATPQAILYGINDRSRLVQSVSELIPAHFPLMYTLAGWGSYDAEVITSGTTDTYGSDVTDQNTAYGTHQSLLAGELLGVGNSIMMKRVKLDGARQALIRLSVEVATFLKPVYQRNENNEIEYHIVNQERVPIIESYINATRLIWHSTETGDGFYPTNFKEFGLGIPLSGVRPGSTQAVLPSYYPKNTLSHGSMTLDPTKDVIQLSSVIYPILDVQLVYDGPRGNRIGFLFNDVTTGNSTNINLSASLGSYVYGLQVVEYDNVTNQRRVINSNLGDSYHNVIFGESVYNPRDNTVMSIKDVIEENYDLFEKAHFYKSNYEKVMSNIINGRTTGGVLVTGEHSYFGQTTETLSIYGLVDILKGVGTDGNPYTSFTVTEGPAFNGILMNSSYPINGIRGSDGLVYDAHGAPDKLENLRLYDEAVLYEFENFGETGYAMTDMAKYPITSVWDTGYSIATKKALASLLARRRDIYIAIATFTVADYVDSVEVNDNRISCAGAISVTAFMGNVLGSIEIDDELFIFSNDFKLQALGDKLFEYGLRLMVSLNTVANGEVTGTTLKSQLESVYGKLISYKSITEDISTDANIIYFIENINPTKDTRVRVRPPVNEYFPEIVNIDESTTRQLEVSLIPIELSHQNATLTKLTDDTAPSDSNPIPYQLTVCLTKYVSQAITCAGATSEAAFILDPRQLYTLKVNSISRGVGLTVNQMLDVFKALKLDTHTYLALNNMI